MPQRITVRATVEDARARGYLKNLKALFPRTSLQSVGVSLAYTIDAKLRSDEVKRIAKCLTNPITEEYSIGTVLAPRSYEFAIEIGFHPGVTDNVGKTAGQMAEDCLGRKLNSSEGVYSSLFIFLIILRLPPVNSRSSAGTTPTLSSNHWRRRCRNTASTLFLPIR